MPTLTSQDQRQTQDFLKQIVLVGFWEYMVGAEV